MNKLKYSVYQSPSIKTLATDSENICNDLEEVARRVLKERYAATFNLDSRQSTEELARTLRLLGIPTDASWLEKGVPDILAVDHNRRLNFFEIKSPKGGPSKDQLDWISKYSLPASIIWVAEYQEDSEYSSKFSIKNEKMFEPIPEFDGFDETVENMFRDYESQHYYSKVAKKIMYGLERGESMTIEELRDRVHFKSEEEGDAIFEDILRKLKGENMYFTPFIQGYGSKTKEFRLSRKVFSMPNNPNPSVYTRFKLSDSLLSTYLQDRLRFNNQTYFQQAWDQEVKR